MWISDLQKASAELQKEKGNFVLKNVVPAFDGIVFHTTAFNDKGEPLTFKWFSNENKIVEVGSWR